jgi:uncharacterized protein YndB with AHSA1/START domain
MSDDTTHHSTFTVERHLATPPARSFRYFADPAMKERWNACHPDWTVLEDRFDFRMGGGEAKRWRLPDGREQTFDARYFDIVEGERIIYAFDMTFGGERVSVSLATIQFVATGDGTRMLYTEQMVFLGDAEARRQRVAGTGMGFDRLVETAAAAVV